MTIQWFPGHMAKAKREIKEMMNLVDIVLEIRDSRIPYSSKNPMVDEIVLDKPRLILLNKASLANKEETKKWVDFLTTDNTLCLDIDCITNYNINQVTNYAKKTLKDLFLKRESKQIKNSSIKALVIGIPNVGKSTFINTLAKRKAVKVGNKPGVTKGQSWIKINSELMFLDTPGILWSKFEDQEVGVKLAICGSIKDEILDLSNLVFKALVYLQKNYPDLLKERYSIDNINDLSYEELIEEIARKRGCILKGNQIDYERTELLIINDIRQNKIGSITFETTNDFIK